MRSGEVAIGDARAAADHCHELGLCLTSRRGIQICHEVAARGVQHRSTSRSRMTARHRGSVDGHGLQRTRWQYDRKCSNDESGDRSGPTNTDLRSHPGARHRNRHSNRIENPQHYSNPRQAQRTSDDEIGHERGRYISALSDAPDNGVNSCGAVNPRQRIRRTDVMPRKSKK